MTEGSTKRDSTISSPDVWFHRLRKPLESADQEHKNLVFISSNLAIFLKWKVHYMQVISLQLRHLIFIYAVQYGGFRNVLSTI
jgi:hypothetical protein